MTLFGDYSIEFGCIGVVVISDVGMSVGGGGSGSRGRAVRNCGGGACLGNGRARLMIHYTFPKIIWELWENLPLSIPFYLISAVILPFFCLSGKKNVAEVVEALVNQRVEKSVEELKT